MSKEENFKLIVDKIISIFDELLSIVIEINNNFESEVKQSPSLTFKIINYRINLLSSRILAFKRLKELNDPNWAVEMHIQYLMENIISFFMEFDNPFLGSERWFQRIEELLKNLADQRRELSKLA